MQYFSFLQYRELTIFLLTLALSLFAHYEGKVDVCRPTRVFNMDILFILYDIINFPLLKNKSTITKIIPNILARNVDFIF